MIRATILPWLIAGMLFAAAAPARAGALKIATIAPDGTNWMQEMRTGAATIADRTAGRVTFKFYPGGVMGNDATVMRKIRAGQLHGGAFTGGSLSELYPDMQVYSLPFLFRDYAEVDAVRARLDPVLTRGLEAKGMVALGISEGGFAFLLSDTPVPTVADLTSKKAWIPEGDAIGAAALRAAGVSPVSLPIADVYTGLQTGLVDTVAATPSAAIAFQWHTRMGYANDLPLSYLIGVLAVSQEGFVKVSPADQEIVRQVMGDVFRRLDRANREDNTAARATLDKRGVPFVRPTPEQRQGWEATGARARADLEARNIFSPDILQQLGAALAAHRG
ncbi:MAG: TRAP transporter substrate-binding protein DctP, partial [Deferrisomatales bacterium]|nr:TRAP transporter substrate-binding protein DctP [Deferrisomatales bacterium]